MDSEALAFIQSLINQINAYATAMEMAAWSQATATTNAANLATGLANAVAAYAATQGQEGRTT